MALNRRVAIYAGTFDPMTRGHEDLVRRAACLFDRVIVAIAQNQPKRPFFSLAERVEMAQEVLHFDNLDGFFACQYRVFVCMKPFW